VPAFAQLEPLRQGVTAGIAEKASIHSQEATEVVVDNVEKAAGTVEKVIQSQEEAGEAAGTVEKALIQSQEEAGEVVGTVERALIQSQEEAGEVVGTVVVPLEAVLREIGWETVKVEEEHSDLAEVAWVG